MRILIFFLSAILTIKANAQADCFFRYCYSGKVKQTTSTKTVKNNDIYLMLPSPELMLGIVDKKRGFIKVKANSQLNYKKESVTIGSSVFCGTSDDIIERVLKGSYKTYTIYIIKGKKRQIKNIHIKNILFSNKGDVINIVLPEIVI